MRSWKVEHGQTYKMIQNLISDNTGHFEALLASDRIHNHVAMDADEMFRIEDAVLILLNHSCQSCFHDACEIVDWWWQGGCGSRVWLYDAGRKEKLMYLSRRIDDLCRKILILVPNQFAKSVLDGRIVAVDEVAVDKLHGQTRFAWTRRGQLHVPARMVLEATHRRLCCRPRPSFFAWAWAFCCWLFAVCVRKLSGSPVWTFDGLSATLRRSCLRCCLGLPIPQELASTNRGARFVRSE